jgi:hypothetical protein
MSTIPSRTFATKEYFLFLLPVFFLFHGFTESFPLVSAIDCLWLLLLYVLSTAVLCTLFYFLFRSWRKATVLSLGVMSFYFFFGSAHDAAKSLSNNAFFTRYSFILPFSLVVLLLIIYKLKRSARKFNRLVQYVNLALVVFILIDVMQLAFNRPANSESKGLPAGFTSCDTCSKPDIYFIIADEYAGSQELLDLFHFDNSPFENALRTRGFFIVDSSVSNYNYTPFSTASILSMDYLQGIEGRNKSRGDRRLCYEKIDHNALTTFLSSQGYVFKNLSVFQFNGQLPPAPSSFFLTGKELITAQTFLARMKRDIAFNLVTRFHLQWQIKNFAETEWSHIEYLLESTKKVATEKATQPRFIYSHLMMPHYPYFFSKDGKKNPPEMALEGSQVMQPEYIGYLQYSNKKFLELIDFILSHAGKPPIIIFMGDHGFRHFTTNVDHRYHFMNLNAVYLPDRGYAGFYKGMSAVNQFRILLNKEFNQQLPVLKDSTSFLIE